MLQVDIKYFPELLEYTVDHLPKTLSVYNWLDVRVQSLISQSNLPFSPSHCIVDTWPCPKIIVCVSRMPLDNNGSDFCLICMWSIKTAEESANFLIKSIKMLKITDCTFCGLERSIGDQLLIIFDDKFNQYKADQCWVKPKWYQKILKMDGE